MNFSRHDAPGVESTPTSGGFSRQLTAQYAGKIILVGGGDVLRFPDDASFALDRPFCEDRPPYYALVSNPSRSDLETFFGIPDEFQRDAGNAAWFSGRADEARRAGYGRPIFHQPATELIDPADVG